MLTITCLSIFILSILCLIFCDIIKLLCNFGITILNLIERLMGVKNDKWKSTHIPNKKLLKS